MSNNIILKAEDVKQHFIVKKERSQKATLYAVDGVTLSINKGETFGLVGESGCGKSTLGKSFLKLYPLTGGKITFAGRDISTLRGKELKDFRCKAQMIFQDPSACLNPRRRVKDILLEPFVIHGIIGVQERKQRILELCDMVGLSSGYLERYPHEMSGGQKQRVGIARALALNPQMIICDEPVSALDVSIQAQVINLMQDLQQEFNLTYLFISHNLSVVKHICQRIAVMYLGKIVELTTSENIYQRAKHPYTQALISAIPVIDGDKRGLGQKEIVLSGDLPSPTSPPLGCAFNTRCYHVMERCYQERPSLQEVEPGHFVSCFLYE